MAAPITWGSLTFDDLVSTPGASSYVLVYSRFQPVPVRRKEAVYSHFGLDGLRVVDGGANNRAWHMVGMIVADNETGMGAAITALEAIQGPGNDTLTAFAIAYEDVDAPGGAKYGDRVTGEHTYLPFEILWRQP
jgi:hypothetical protein